MINIVYKFSNYEEYDIDSDGDFITYSFNDYRYTFLEE